MRSISGPAAAALDDPLLPIAVLIDMALTSPLRVCTGGWHLTWASNVYTAAGSLGSVEPTTESTGEPKGLRFNLSGVPSSMIALALAEPVQGKAVNLYVAIFDPATYQILDAALEWSGRLDTMVITEDGSSATITATAEHAGVDLLRAVPVRYTDIDQQRLYAGDLGFQYVTDQADQTIVWPAATFFRQ